MENSVNVLKEKLSDNKHYYCGLTQAQTVQVKQFLQVPNNRQYFSVLEQTLRQFKLIEY